MIYEQSEVIAMLEGSKVNNCSKLKNPWIEFVDMLTDDNNTDKFNLSDFGSLYKFIASNYCNDNSEECIEFMFKNQLLKLDRKGKLA